jgi:hypothetical protein
MCSTISTLPQFLDLADFALPPQSGTQIGPGIHDLFNYSLSQKLKHPRVRLLSAEGQVVILQRAGSKSRYLGQILIVDDGRYPHNLYFGRIDLEGVLHAARAMTVAVRELIEQFAANPREVAFSYGQLSGRCCFCDALLSDARSLGHGYGQVCARNWGLPWDANRQFRGMRDSLYFTILVAKQKYESKATR